MGTLLLRRASDTSSMAGFSTATLPGAIEPKGLDLAVELAHDIRSPLSAVIALTELLQRNVFGPLTDAQKQHLQMVLQAARGISLLTSEVVESAHDGDFDAPATMSLFDVPAALRAVGEIVQPMAESAGLRLVVRNFAPDRWTGCRSAVTRVLLNLTTNALKYTDHGVVEFGAHLLSPRKLEFFVRDTGRGFTGPRLVSEADVDIPAPDRWRETSTGLGLAICHRLLRSMGSTLNVAPSPGGGTRFHFVLALPEQV